MLYYRNIRSICQTQLYATMNFEYYSVDYIHSLIKQQLTINDTFQSRTIYTHSLHVFRMACGELVKYADEVLLDFLYHLIFNAVKRFINVCSKM
ncbi:unnamed protein product [Rotaria magnacalcarata]